MAERMIVTCALPYANGSIHLGHMVEYIQADIYVRFLKLLGKNVLYICADDTHGTPIELKALEQKITPEKLIEKYHAEHLKDFTDFHVAFDNYYTTNSPENKHFSDLFFMRLKEKGYVYKKILKVIFCDHCARFLPDRYVKGTCPNCKASDQYGDVCEKCNKTHKTTDLLHPKCSLCNHIPIVKESLHYFFKLSAFEQKLSNYLLGNKNLQPEIVHFVMNWITQGLEDWCISRDGPYFGFKIPGEENKYYYVWLDAPIGYIASTENYYKKHPQHKEDRTPVTSADYWQLADPSQSNIMHIIGKDIVYFHYLFWPAMLMAADFKLPDKLLVHGFLTVNKEKMSKSRGTFITARRYLTFFNPEYLRYYYASHLTSKPTDLDLDLQHFEDTINQQLIANIANLTYRAISFLNKNFGSKITTFHEPELVEHITPYFEEIKQWYEKCEIANALKDIAHVSSLGNKYFQDHEPWKLAKENPAKAQEVLTFTVNLLKNLSILLYPIMPVYSAELQHQLNVKSLSWKDLNFSLKNHTLNEGKIILQRIEKTDRLIETSQESTSAATNTGTSSTPAFPFDLRVAEILEVHDHPNADKLYVMKIAVDMKGTTRQLVGGIRQFYTSEQLIGKHLIIVANLQPAKIRRVESQGMLLAADFQGTLKVLEAPRTALGQPVYFTQPLEKAREISYKEFEKHAMVVKHKKVLYENHTLKTPAEEICVDVPDGAVIG